MEGIRSLPEYQVAPPPPNLPENGGDIRHPSAHPPIQLYHHTTALNHAQQPLSYSLCQAIPGYEYSQYALARTVSAHVLQDPYALQGGVAGYGGYAISAAPHPHSGAGHLDPAPYAPGVVVGGTSGETYDHGGADIRTHAWKEAIRLYGGNPSKSNYSGVSVVGVS
ncbi:hypothetical protein AXF42_Ash009168 [Apostasia shenzhenica]|uniref:Uncharacterized protein n=1 Tax=Apostasia shenzhenica TaxID=1088818 RepID=A0A2I0ADP2_9ASPA|nr:hypothetical protein AXF42_Ash009168 [Apostasia shenzhenica]